MQTISQFARERGVEPQAVSIYLRRHGAKYDKKTGLTDKQIEMLEEAYPLPQPVEIIEDKESRQKLIKAQELIIQLQSEMLDLKGKLATAEAAQLMLEDRDRQIAELKEALETEKTKTWWQKLLKR